MLKRILECFTPDHRTYRSSSWSGAQEVPVPESGRYYKDAVYEQLALVGKALSSAPRLEMLDVLLQAGRTVEVLAAEVEMSVANTSHHLQVLKRARLVEAERRGQFVTYRVADPTVGELLSAVRVLGERRLSEIDRVTQEFLADRQGMVVLDRQALRERIASGDCLVLDVRPVEEYAAAHVAGALSVPLEELERRLEELPRDRQIVAYCRGPYCVLAADAVDTLRRHGLDAVRATEAVQDWRALGVPVVTSDGSYPSSLRQGDDP
jgi:rhodanese-related sulfurtransferase/DNA-binding transcriptional ArsR family regulator